MKYEYFIYAESAFLKKGKWFSEGCLVTLPIAIKTYRKLTMAFYLAKVLAVT